MFTTSWGHCELDFWPLKSNQFIFESNWKFVSNLKKFPQDVFELLCSQEHWFSETLTLDSQPLKSNQFFSESKWTFEPNLKKFPSDVLETTFKRIGPTTPKRNPSAQCSRHVCIKGVKCSVSTIASPPTLASAPFNDTFYYVEYIILLIMDSTSLLREWTCLRLADYRPLPSFKWSLIGYHRTRLRCHRCDPFSSGEADQ